MIVRYRTSLEDNSRWQNLRFRDGDIVISTPAKTGTTWVQMICALLIFQSADLPAPLAALSPWLDTRLRPPGAVCDHLEAQRHRRFIKTHTPLDGIPFDHRVTYVVVGRDPRDVAVSLYHHRNNLKPSIFGAPSARRQSIPPSFPQSLLSWLNNDDAPQHNLVTLKGMVWHLADAWSRRHQPNVALVHYHDLRRDLPGQMRWLAGLLGIDVAETMWPILVNAATFERMRQRSALLAPDADILDDAGRFFRSGPSGGWRTWLTEQDLDRYDRRLAELADPELIGWLHAEVAPS
ncbi:sulfotransferase domain-containing protein [Micromonospora sp. Llam0]|uniref:sulfotransferase domain-containing protein n=1 Tax=Micromonospora sp. Llam0 TaxID=2485143 RepID=UPI000F4ADE7F|nr:sulfotransferase domain-containing protein [Micromonospora sp. Llam0]ROO52003.1 sulfotransferase domain-containing protein [Micromonospora sp. Llam0]